MHERRIPTLVSLCQRVAAVHVDCISSLGDELRYDLVKPILERCTVDQLLRLEQASPHLERDTPGIWKQLCFKSYPAAADRYNSGELPEPDSWRDKYFALVEEEERRIEEIGNKLRRQRQEADERRKEQEIKYTTQVPTAKRKWGVAAPPKTLFQKTRSEASRLQKNIYRKPMLPSMPNGGKSYRVLPPNNSALLPTSQTSGSSSRVTVTTVVHKVPTSTAKPISKSIASGSNSSAISGLHNTAPSTSTLKPPPSISPEKRDEPPRKKQRPNPTEASGPSPRKQRDPGASLFMPKHRAYSQRVS
ncbi:hypothetical protein MIND_01079200 [Mycena indigotica]|uniref:Elongin-A n=1 Tax=Mycena indigotica TaxID=2126181 RepID=A0A8H6VXD8_9AGAR|nr:uncharacterized protein MIND_01079200 [Mycena indigotica]KAF7295396.1 hypothetical protein MIND_01079200 [Mycena indigotica]